MPRRKRENRYGTTPETRTPTLAELGVREDVLEDDTVRTAVQIEERYPPFTIRDRPLSWNAHRRLLETYSTTADQAYKNLPAGLWQWLVDKASDAGCQLSEFELLVELWRWKHRQGAVGGVEPRATRLSRIRANRHADPVVWDWISLAAKKAPAA